MGGSLIHKELTKPMLLEVYDNIRKIMGRAC